MPFTISTVQGFERQRGFIERRIEVQLKTPSPETRLQFGDTGLELLVRYPVEIRNESVTDEQVTRKVLEVIQSDPEVQAAVVGRRRFARRSKANDLCGIESHWSD